MTSIGLVLAAIGVLGCSGVPACLLPSRSPAGQRLTVLLMTLGSALGLCGVVLSLRDTAPVEWNLAWMLPWGRFAVSIDAISAMFLGPVFAVPALGSIYGLRYWSQSEHPDNGRWLGLFYGLLAAGIALVFIARDGVLFLIAWEVMALAAYFALVTEGDKPEVRRVAWVYLVATHVSTLCLFAMFALWRRATGTFALESGTAVAAGMASPIFVLGLVGFGFKAGLLPFHFWLPGAHAAAPSHLSALMSGVMLKAGVYGLVRIAAVLPQPPLWWGATLLATGAITGIAGIAFAASQHDFKRLLAYSSVENIGIIAMGIGLALLGRTMGRTDWILLGMGGALLHVWNHSLFKSLLFLGAGAVLHAVHTRDMDQLGGLGRRMPRTMGLFAFGAIAICALPPLNGFVSEWLLYAGLFRTLGLDGTMGVPGAAVAAIALAVIGALAVACFVKVFGAIFLGSPRSEVAQHAHEPPPGMLGPMTLLAAGCACIGLFPFLVAPLLERASAIWAAPMALGAASLRALVPLGWLGASGWCLVLLAALTALVLKLLARRGDAAGAPTWGCGYARPSARMQYSGSSFTQMIAGLTGWIIWPSRGRPVITGIFAAASRFATEVPDVVLDRGLSPAAAALTRLLPWVRRFQQGSAHVYLLYMLLIIVFLFLLGA